MDEVRRLGFIDSRVVGRWKDELMRMKTDDVVRSSGSIVYWGGGGVLGSGDARIVGPGYVWCTQDGGRNREGRQQQ